MDKTKQPAKGYSDAPTKPGYPIDKSLQEASHEDLKRGFQKPK
jgi:hypothetical protein